MNIKCLQTTGKKISDSFEIGRNMMVVTVFLSILTPMKFRWIHILKENYYYDHIPFNLKVIINLSSV